MSSENKLIFFKTQNDFRKWLTKNYLTKTELLVGFYKVGSEKPSIRWSESVDQALCFGWIDGLRKSVDSESYSIRFTPRKANSIWSKINIKKIEVLTESGLMMPEGLVIFEKRTTSRSMIYSYEVKPFHFSAAFEKKFKANKKAWNYFQKQAPSYRKVATKWVMTAVQEATQLRRMTQLINDCEVEKRLKHLDYPSKK